MPYSAVIARLDWAAPPLTKRDRQAVTVDPLPAADVRQQLVAGPAARIGEDEEERFSLGEEGVARDLPALKCGEGEVGGELARHAVEGIFVLVGQRGRRTRGERSVIDPVGQVIEAGQDAVLLVAGVHQEPDLDPEHGCEYGRGCQCKDRHFVLHSVEPGHGQTPVTVLISVRSVCALGCRVELTEERLKP